VLRGPLAAGGYHVRVNGFTQAKMPVVSVELILKRAGAVEQILKTMSGPGTTSIVDELVPLAELSSACGDLLILRSTLVSVGAGDPGYYIELNTSIDTP